MGGAGGCEPDLQLNSQNWRTGLTWRRKAPKLALRMSRQRRAGVERQVLTGLGERLAMRRLERNLSQAVLAKEAGVSQRTIVRLESGQSTQLANLVRVLRALGLLDGLWSAVDALVPRSHTRPLAQLREQEEGQARRRRRASSRPAKSASRTNSAWSWGDEAPGELP